MSEEKEKPASAEQALAKLLEAAYVLQEHNRESQALNKAAEENTAQNEDKQAAPAPAIPEPVVPGPSIPAPVAYAPVIPAPAPEPAITVQPEPMHPSLAESELPLAQIVETQHKIQAQHLGVEAAMFLVAERVVEITRAAGAAIGMVEGKVVRYRAVAGQKTPAAGGETSLEKALCIPCIRTGEAFRCPEVTSKIHLDVDECRQRKIRSLLAVPIFHNGSAVGGLELYYSTPRGFSEQDIHTSQLMAGLITEALAREEELTSRKSLAGERNRMLEALERLKPNLSALVDKSPAARATKAASTNTCVKCGHQLVGEELFCGQCGAARLKEQPAPAAHAEEHPAAPGPGKNSVAEIPNSNLAIDEAEDVDHVLSGTTLDELAKSFEDEMPELFADPDLEIKAENGAAKASIQPMTAKDSEAEISEGDEAEFDADSDAGAKEEEKSEESLALAKPVVADWSSAHSAREFFEQLAGASRRRSLARFWNERRGDIYLAIAVILVACVIRWGIWSSPSVNAKGAPNAAAHKANPDAGLSYFDRMLISLGLAEAPETPEDKGNPNAQVWVDMHTALYYCPGADLYGKTPSGKYTTQREAQLDQFEPAYRQTCK